MPRRASIRVLFWFFRVVSVIGAVPLVGAACRAADSTKHEADALAPTRQAPLASSPSSPPAPVPSPPDASAPPGASPNLLDIVPARMAVSSTVVNPHDFPEHLVDGRMDTAWNSKTGDLVGGSISFRVPSDAHVDRIEMTVGFDRVKGKVDLFTANHRITKVEVSRDKTPLRIVSLDPDNRGLQIIAIDGPGGDYEVKVLATKPGTNKAWRELTVSELRVVGTPGREQRSVDDPLRVSIGSLDAEPPDLSFETRDAALPGVYKDVAALCAAWERAQVANAAERKSLVDRARDSHLTVGAPSCREEAFAPAFRGDATYKSARAVRISDGVSQGHALVVELARGFALSGISWSWNDPFDPGCPSIVRDQEIGELRVENGHFVAAVDGERVTYVTPTSETDDGSRDARVRGAAWCKDDGKELACRFYSPSMKPPLGSKVQPARSSRQRRPWSELPWIGMVPFAISADGMLHVLGKGLPAAP